MKKLINLLTVVSTLLLCISCSSSTIGESENQKHDETSFTQCEEPRPQMCTREYMPVCAVKNTGVQCVTTPCSSTEETTYATGCTACADSKVIKYKQGECGKG